MKGREQTGLTKERTDKAHKGGHRQGSQRRAQTGLTKKGTDRAHKEKEGNRQVSQRERREQTGLTKRKKGTDRVHKGGNRQGSQRRGHGSQRKRGNRTHK